MDQQNKSRPAHDDDQQQEARALLLQQQHQYSKSQSSNIGSSTQYAYKYTPWQALRGASRL